MGEPVGRAVRLAEVPLCVRRPRTRVHRIADFLFGQPLARDVDRPEPRQLLAVRPLADVDREPVVEDEVSSVVRQVAVAEHRAVPVDEELVGDVLADGERPLLPVQHLGYFSGEYVS